MDVNKIGICEWSMPIDGPAACKLASELGISGIQLDIGPYERDFCKSKAVVQEAWLEEAEKYNIKFPSMAARVSDYYSMVDEPGTEEHEIVRDGVLRAVKACGSMKIPVLLIPNFEKSYISTDRHFEIACDLMKEACGEAEKAGVTIAAENTLSVQKTLEMLKRVAAENFGLYFDFQNYFLANGDYTPGILEVHVKDGKGSDLSGALLGTGDVHFYESMDVLKKNGYDGWLVSENYYDMQPLCRPGDDPVEIIRADLDILRAAIKG
jgi:sugar phosphate isomerase/epimerase